MTSNINVGHFPTFVVESYIYLYTCLYINTYGNIYLYAICLYLYQIYRVKQNSIQYIVKFIKCV